MKIYRSQLALLALAIGGGCSQIIGLSDYEIDPSLDKPGQGGEGGQAQGEGGGGNVSSGGKSMGGKAGEAGEGTTGGTEPMGGEPAMGGGPPIGAGGEGGAPAGMLVPCDSQDCCDQEGGTAVGIELLADGSFEAGFVLDGNSPWTEESTNAIEIITNADYGFDLPPDGEFYAYLSGIQGERSTIYSENFIVPDDAGWLVLTGQRLFQIDIQDDVNTDFCGIGFYGPAAEDIDLVELPFFWTAPGAGSDGWGEAPTWRAFEASWPAEPHQGGLRHLGVRGESDLYPPDDGVTGTSESSSYLFDDLSLQAFRCFK